MGMMNLHCSTVAQPLACRPGEDRDPILVDVRRQRTWIPIYIGMTTSNGVAYSVVPAQAGTQRRLRLAKQSHWIPACAGTTILEASSLARGAA
jgi:hypothetical protein